MTTPSTSPDIFEILDIEEREDTYSRLLVHILERSPGLRKRLLQHAFGDHAPSADPATVTLRHHLGDAGVVDILMLGPKDAPRPWALFIESKLFSGEHSNQTEKYLAAVQAMVAPNNQASGIFLTIAGDSAQAPEVKPLTHRELTGWILEHMTDFREHPALCIAAEAYARRAQVPLPERAEGDTAVRSLLKPMWGLVPHLAGVSALGAALRHGLSGEWMHTAIWIQGRGHANPGLQFWQPVWCGTEIVEPRWTPDNIFVHLEIELTESPPWRLKVHFETEPYYTQGELQGLQNHAGFAAMRDVFRATLHAQTAQIPQWKLTNYRLQSAIIDAPVGPDATVAQLHAHFAPAMSAIAPCITHALTQARAAMAPAVPQR